MYKCVVFILVFPAWPKTEYPVIVAVFVGILGYTLYIFARYDITNYYFLFNLSDLHIIVKY